ncbi:ABC transporter substrate-binding protein [Variovorax sp.]|jgi:branched-chain amino acid transport system substrate-binding protein|uniref:ABC transporter substrate-binding protein n=1 Tax=Variovorax sp. TaxID=1871043 RepID=UPI0012099A69|nr:ABC transporter substrate-binding protein [Variovorax sp.]TAJ61778.1 MAG: ABC transporter substrate-binding protein [Variovorax sp.]
MTVATPRVPPSPVLPTGRRRALGRIAATAFAAGLGLPAFAQNRPLRIGATFDNSSVEKVNGQGLFQGSSAFFAAMNRAGGFNGTRVELVMADDQFKPELAKANALAFEKDASVLALLHPLGTRPSSEVMDAVPGMAVVGPLTGTLALRKKNAPNTFWVRVNYAQEIEKLVSTARVLGQDRIGLVHSDDPLGQSLLAAFKASLAKAKLEPAVVATTPNTTSMEVGPAATAIAQAKPQVVIVGLAGTAPVFLKALREAGGNSSAYGLSITASSLGTLGELSRGLGFTIVVPSPNATKFEIVRRYQADMVANGTREFSLASLEGYVNAAVLAEGMRRAGPSLNRASVLQGLERIEGFDLGGLKLNYGRANREGGNFVDVAVIGSRGQMLS